MASYDQIKYASLTDVGVRRSHNQDSHGSVLASDEERWRIHGHIFQVSDGMGGHAVGELASELAVRTIPHTYHKYAAKGVVPALRKAFTDANATIHEKGQQNQEFAGMGTTTTALILRPEGAWIGHVGDSRAYRVRAGKIEQLSFDHSLLWEMAKTQGVDPDDLEGSVPSNRICRSLGPEPEVEADIQGPHPVQSGDIFVLCSDGLSGPVTDPEIGAVASALEPQEACRFLVDLANLRGGPDNITVVIVRPGDGIANESSRAKSAAGKQKGGWGRFPWALMVLFVGLLLAAGAVFLTYQRRPEGTMVFVLAALAIVGGLAGLVVQLIWEKQHPPPAPIRPRMKVYRNTPCQVDRGMVDKLAKGTVTLKQRFKDKNWTVDWGPFHKHHELAEKLMGKGDLPEAFREYCRAMAVLTEFLRKQRNKEEAFQPVWDKHK